MQIGNNSQGVARLGRPLWWICSHLPRVKEQASAPIIAPRRLCEHTRTRTHTNRHSRLDKVIGRGVTAENSERPARFLPTPDCMKMHTSSKCFWAHILGSSCRLTPVLDLNAHGLHCSLPPSPRLLSPQHRLPRLWGAAGAGSAPRASALWLTVKEVILWAPYLRVGPLIMVRKITVSFTHSHQDTESGKKKSGEWVELESHLVVPR